MPVTVVPALALFICTPIAVYDGDGPIWCAEGPHVRLAGIAAREMDGTCNANQPCPAVSAERSRDELAAMLGAVRGLNRTGHILISGPPLRCRSVGGAGGTRTAAWCVSPTKGDINCAMVKRGFALKWQKYWKGHACSP